MARILQEVERNKASQGLRFANYFIDGIIIRILYFGIFFMLGIVYELIGIEYGSEDAINIFINLFIILGTIFFYYYLCEKYLDGKTVAKHITGTKVVCVDGSKPTSRQIINRTLSRFVPFDQFSFLGDNGWHDSWSDTRVVKIKDYENAINLQKDMEDLGKPENS